jgi:uncharacterized protein
VKYNRSARLDTSQVTDARGGGSRMGGKTGLAIGGGGGVIGIVIVLLITLLNSNGGSNTSNVLGSLAGSGNGATADNAQVATECKTGADAQDKLDCAVVADIDSIQAYWAKELPSLGATYRPAPTVWFTGQVNTGCGPASSGVGPFYCPADKKVYIDLTFYDELQSQFGAKGGLFVDAYVLAHEYGHHVQDLLGTSARVKPGDSGPTSGSVRLELQADCYAGVWAHHATTTPGSDGQPLITDITPDDIDRALDAAAKIGDDYIQTHLGGGRVDQSQFTHGSSAQRRKWFTTGYDTGNPRACDTFSTNNLG